LVERESEDLSVRIQVELLSLNRSGVYYHPQPPSPAEIQLKHRIDAIYTKWPFYGSRKITAQLQLEGVEINRKATQRHMREMGIAGICPGPNLSKRTQKEGIFPYLLRHTTSHYPNHIWGLDIHLHSLARRLDVSSSGVGLVLAVRGELGTGRVHWNYLLS